MTPAERPTRAQVLGDGLARSARWSGRIALLALGLVVAGFVVKYTWVVLLPVVLAVAVSTVLAPPVHWLVRHGWKPALAATAVVVAAVAVLAGLVALVVPPVVDQAASFGSRISGGLTTIKDWLQGPPLNVDNRQLDTAIDAVIAKVQSSATTIAGGVLSTVGAVTSAVTTLVLVLFLTFYFVKDGRRFLPWLDGLVGARRGGHVDELLQRCWTVLGGFLRVQALVSLIDAVFIGLGLVVVGVPLALPIAVVTFLGGFVPLVGAVVAGAIGVLVALVTGGWVKALIVLGIILLVQQLEGNVLSPVLQSRELQLHPVVVLLAVTLGGSLFGIVGAFLAVPVAAVGAVTVRFVGELVDARTGAAPPGDAEPAEG